MSTVKQQMSRLEDAMAELAETAKKTEDAVQRTEATADRVLQHLDAQGQTMFARWDKDRAAADREWGRLANKMGTLVEDIVAPGLPAIFEQMFGLAPSEYSAQRVRRCHLLDPGRMREFDYVAMAGGFVLVNETKSTLRPENVADFVAALQEIRNYLPEAEGRVVVGGLAAFSLDPSLVIAGERHGLLMLGLGTGLMRVLNSAGFVPTRF